MFSTGRSRLFVAALLVLPTWIGLAAAPAAEAASGLSGIVFDSLGSDGFNTGTLSRLSTTGSTIVESVSGAYTRFTVSGQPVDVYIAPPTGQTFTAGQTYPIAANTDATNAGVRFDWGSCGSLPTSGSVQVLEATPSATATYSVFAATFEVGCGTGTPLYGEIRYNSSIDVTSTAENWTVLQFGSVPAGTAAAPKSVTITNNGTLPTTLGTAAITGTDAADFAVTSDSCSGAQLATAATCTVTVTATPEAGQRSATLSVPDGSARGARAVTLRAIGQTAPGTPRSVATRTASDGVALTWSPPSDTGNSPVTSYDVLRGTAPDALSVVATVTLPKYADRVSDTTALGTSYYYAVRATNAIGTGPASDPVAGTTPASVVVPTDRHLFAVEGGHGSFVAGDASYFYTADPEHPTAMTLGPYSNGFIVGGNGPTSAFFVMNWPAGSSPAPGTYQVTGTGTGVTTQLGVGGSASQARTVVINRMDIDSAGAIVALSADITTGSTFASIRYGTDDPITAVNIDPIDAGTIALGTAATSTATYTNVGDNATTIGTVSVVPSDGASSTDWSAPGPDTCTGAVVPAGGSCTVGLSVTPTAGATRTGELVVTDNSPAGTHERSLTVFAKTAPPAPRSLTATRAADGKVTLGWSDDGGLTGTADSFTVSVGSSPDALHVLATQPAAPSGYDTYTDPDPSDGLRYYSVTATNIAGTGPAATLQVDAALHTPADLGVSPLIHGAAVTWTAPDGYPAGPVTYDVYRGPNASSLVKVATTTTTTAQFAGLTTGSTYVVAVLARTANGHASALTPPVSFTAPSSELMVVDAHPSGNYGLSRASLTAGAPADAPLAIPASPDTDVFNVVAAPNGTRIAYDTLSYGNWGDIWVANSDGSGTPTPVVSGTNDDEGPAWSLDGTALAYTRFYASDSVLMTVSPSGGSPQPVPNSSNLSGPTWIGPHTLVAEDDSTATAPLVEIDSITGARTLMTNTATGYFPVANPSGTSLAYLGGDVNSPPVLWVATLAGVRHAVALPPGTIDVYSIAWSRDQNTLYIVADTGTSTQVWSTPAAGGGTPVRITALGTDPMSAAIIAPDTTPPTVSVTKLPAVTLASTVKVSYAGRDAVNGIGHYDVRYTLDTPRVHYSARPVTGANGTTATSVVMRVAQGDRYCFSVRAADRVGNVSAWSTPTCTSTPLDDRGLYKSSGVSMATGSAYYLGTISTMSRYGQIMYSTVSALDLVVTTCSTCGSVTITQQGHTICTFNLHSTSTVYRRVLAIPATRYSGNVTIHVVSSGKRVLIDGMVLKPV